MGAVIQVAYEVCRWIAIVVFLVDACMLLTKALDKEELRIKKFFFVAVSLVLANNVYSAIDLALKHVPAAERNATGAFTAVLLMIAITGEHWVTVWGRFVARHRARAHTGSVDEETP